MAMILVLALVLGIGVMPRSAAAHHGVHGHPRGHVFFAPARPFVAPFRVHPRGFRHFLFAPVAPFPAAVFVGPFWFWNGFSWVLVPGHWAW